MNIHIKRDNSYWFIKYSSPLTQFTVHGHSNRSWVILSLGMSVWWFEPFLIFYTRKLRVCVCVCFVWQLLSDVYVCSALAINTKQIRVNNFKHEICTFPAGTSMYLTSTSLPNVNVQLCSSITWNERVSTHFTYHRWMWIVYATTHEHEHDACIRDNM